MTSAYQVYMEMVKSAASDELKNRYYHPYATKKRKNHSAVEGDDNETALRHVQRIARDSGNNVLFGMMANWRGSGPTSIVAPAVGGVIDGALMRPLFDGSIQLIGRGLNAVSSNGNER